MIETWPNGYTVEQWHDIFLKSTCKLEDLFTGVADNSDDLLLHLIKI